MISERLSSKCTSVRKECLSIKFMMTSWKHLGRSLLLIAQRKDGQQSLKGGRESVEDDGRSGRSKDATADENVKVVHILVMYDSWRDE